MQVKFYMSKKSKHGKVPENGANCNLTKFQWQVLEQTAKIPFGETRSYKWVAEQIGRPKAFRAVGQALRRNPYPIIIPCHRVIKEDGELGGYSGGPSDKKEDLLFREQAILKKIREVQ
ncbi:MAG: MGMT family protein [Candidatus Omnitrophica bacterium]|nr:MGMT family protein [Candidatus Omnitrophota bacterium]